MGFIDVIKERARADKKVIVLPESEDRRTYEAAAQIMKEEIAYNGVSVIIPRRECIVALNKRLKAAKKA